MSLSPAELSQFHDVGYLVKPGVFTADDLQPIKDGITEIIDGRARELHAEGRLADICEDEPFERRLARIFELDEAVGDEIYGTVLGGGGGGFNGQAMLELFRHPPLLSCIETIIGPDIIGSSVYRIRPKIPHMPHGEVPWHQDSGYLLAHCDRHLIVTVWVPLIDVNLENGCLYVLPNVHKLGIIRHCTGAKAGYLEIPEDARPDTEPVPIEMEAGGVLLMTNMTPHASFENRTDQVRWSLDLRFQGMETPSNVDETPADYTPERDPVTMACYPAEADFVIQDTHEPSRDVTPEEFRRIRQRFDRGHAHSPGRGWKPLTEGR